MRASSELLVVESWVFDANSLIARSVLLAFFGKPGRKAEEEGLWFKELPDFSSSIVFCRVDSSFRKVSTGHF